MQTLGFYWRTFGEILWNSACSWGVSELPQIWPAFFPLAGLCSKWKVWSKSVRQNWEPCWSVRRTGIWWLEDSCTFSKVKGNVSRVEAYYLESNIHSPCLKSAQFTKETLLASLKPCLLVPDDKATNCTASFVEAETALGSAAGELKAIWRVSCYCWWKKSCTTWDI